VGFWFKKLRIPYTGVITLAMNDQGDWIATFAPRHRKADRR